MSIQRITDILNHGSVIRVDLLADQLKLAFNEVLTIITQQDSEIQGLKEQIKELTTKEEFSRISTKNAELLSHLQQEFKDTQVYTDERLDFLTRDFTSFKETQSESCSALDAKFTKQIDSQEQLLNGQLFVLKQQDLKTEITQLKESLDQIDETTSNIQSKLSVHQEHSVSDIDDRLTKLEQSLAIKNSSSKEIQDKLVQDLDELKKQHETFKHDIRDELHFCQVGVDEIKHMIVDTPDLSIDGVIDTEAVVRAIQRDSRRIDNFDETLMIVRDQHNELRGLIEKTVEGLHAVENNILTFVQDYNDKNNKIKLRIEEESSQTYLLSEDIAKLANDQHSFVETSTNNNTIFTNALYQLRTFLSKLSTRVLPNFELVDDSTLAFQTLTDKFLQRSEEITKHISDQTQNPLSESQLEIPFIQIKIPPQHERLRVPKSVERDKGSLIQTIASPEVLSAKQGNSDIEIQLKTLKEEMEKLKNFVNGKLDQKANQDSIERMLDKLRGTIGVVRTAVNQINRELNNYMKKEEYELAKKDEMANQRSGKTSKSLHIQSKSSSLTSPGYAHQLLYGESNLPELKPTY